MILITLPIPFPLHKNWPDMSGFAVSLAESLGLSGLRSNDRRVRLSLSRRYFSSRSVSQRLTARDAAKPQWYFCLRAMPVALITIVLCSSLNGQTTAPPQASPSPSSSQLTLINNYCTDLKAYAKNNLKRALFFGDVASYDQNSMTLTAPPPNWKQFKSQKARDDAGNGDNLFNTANVWTKNGNIVLANLQYGSPSGDWGQFVSYCFREDGSLAKLEDTFRSFAGPISTVKEKIYDTRGTRLRSSIRCYKLGTRRREKCEGTYSNYDADVYLRVSQLPIHRAFRSGKNQ